MQSNALRPKRLHNSHTGLAAQLCGDQRAGTVRCRGVGMLAAPLQSVARGNHRVAVLELDQAAIHLAAR